MAKRPTDIMKAMAEKTAEGGGPKRLYAWLRTRYDELAAAKAEFGPTWKQFADTVIAAGARMGNGRTPTEHAVRKAFLRVERDLAAEKKAPFILPLSSRRPRGAVVEAPPRQTGEPIRQTGTTQAPPPSGGRAGSEDLKRVLGEMGQRANKLPDPLK
jgi:hypothetical protein